MVLRPIYDPRANMAGYPPSGPPPGYPHGESGQQHLGPQQWQGYPPSQGGSPYASQHSPMTSTGQQYSMPQGSPYPPPSPHGSGYYPPQQPQYAGSPPPAGQYPPTGYGYNGQQGQQSYYSSSHQSPYPPASPYLPPVKPQYVQSAQHAAASQGYPPQIKQEYNSAPIPGQVPQSEEERGLMGALAGGAAGAFAGTPSSCRD